MSKVYFYYSAMNAGKSTNLLQSAYNYNERGMQCILFTPELDDRFGKGVFASRIGLSSSAVSVSKNFDLFAYAQERQASSQNLACVLIDEAQFLTREQVRQLTDISDILDIPVLAYGLRTDFLGQLFEGSKWLLAWADELRELKAVCFCGKKATMNMRQDKNGKAVTEGKQIDIGAEDKYVSLCRKHFKEKVISKI
jgi:thymidine kinase